MIADEDGYKKTLFDKRGPEAAQFNQIVSSLIIPVVAGVFIGCALSVKRDLSAPLVVVSSLAGAILLGTCWWYFVSRVSRSAGAVFGEFIQPTGNRTPYEP